MPDAASALQILGGALNPDGAAVSPGPSPGSPQDEQGATDSDSISSKLSILSQARAGKLPSSVPDYGAKLTGTVANAGAGANDAIAGTLGAPVDLMTGAVNLASRGINAVAGTNIPTIDNPPGGSESVKGLLGYLGADPRNVVPADNLDQIARGGGAGIAGTLLPGMAARSLVGAAAVPARSLADHVLQSFASGSPGNLAVVGGLGGAGGEAASQQVPEPWKPLANFLGNLAVGGGAALGYEGAKALGSAASNLASNYFAPFTVAGRSKIAGQTLANSATGGRAGLLDALDQPEAGGIIPVSEPTTFQATGNLGIGGLERARSNSNPEPFIQRRADQNAARTGVLDNLAPQGAQPGAVGEFFKQHLSAMDLANDAAVGNAQINASNLLSGLGGDLQRNEYGSQARQALEDAKGAVKQDEAAKWAAIDPDGKLAVDVSPVTKAASDIPASMSGSAKPMEGEEAAIFNVAQSYPGVVPFRELGDLRGRVLAQIREIRPAGESPELRRLTMLRQSIDDAMASGAENKAAELAPNSAGALPDIPSQLQSAPWAKDVPPEQLRQMAAAYQARTGAVSAPATGSAVYTPSGRRIDIQHEVTDLGAANPIVASHDASLRANPNYPPELQPRDRARAASATQIADIAGNLQPERLGASMSPAEGAPIVGPDHVVESGNARVLALAKAYRENMPQAQAYRSWLESQGIDTTGKAAPVLIRRRLTPLSPAERVQFAQEANAPSVLSMSSTERAAQDAGRLSDNVLSMFRGGDMRDAGNRDFVRGFVGSVPERGEVGTFATPDGQLSIEGERRIQAALLQKAYDNPNLVRALTETGDENIRAFGGGLADAAGDFAKLRSDIQAGRVEPSMDISKAVNEAASLVQNARAKGIPLRDAVAQQDAFTRIAPATERLLQGAYGEDLSGRVSRARVADLLRVYSAEASKQSTEARLFGEASLPTDILNVARARYGAGPQSIPAIARFSRNAEGIGTGGAGSGQEAPRSGDGAAGQAARGRGDQSSRILPEIPLTPNFDEAAAARYAAAREATREKKQTFSAGPVGQALQAGRNGLPYSVADSQVAGKFFNKGPKAFEDVQAFSRAVGGDGHAVDILRDYAAADLRNYAERADGSIDPAKLGKWLDDHHDALRAFPALADKFRDVAAAQRAVDDMIAARASDRDLYVKGAAQHFLGTDPLIAVERALSSRDPSATFSQLASSLKGDKDAREGLQAAVRDYIKRRYQSNAEAATSGVPLLKADQLQTFIKKNEGALRWVLSHEQLDGMQAVAADLQRANRSIVGGKLPGQSNTPQDLAAMQQHAENGRGVVGNALSHGGDAVMFYILERLGEHLGGGLMGSAAGAGLFVGGKVMQAMRAAGINDADKLIDKALLDPALARALVTRAKAPGDQAMARTQLLAALQRLAIVSGAHTLSGAAEQKGR